MTTLLTVSLIEENGQISIDYQNGDPTSLVKPETIEQLIDVLGHMRSAMAPPRVPVEPQAGQPMKAVPDPRWYVGSSVDKRSAFVSLHHPGYGWTPYALPLVSAKAFHEQIGNAIESIESAQTGK